MANNIKALRIASGKTQKEVASDLDVKLSTYQGWEQGKRNPTGRMGLRIARYFGTTTDTVFGSQFAEPVRPNLSSDEESLIEMYRRLGDDAKLAVKTVAYALGVNRTDTES